MKAHSMLTRERLDGTVVDIEFMLIAVIQGLALTTLAVESEEVIGGLQWEYWPYMIAGFFLIMNFWSQAIIHSISFVSWPFDPIHTVLYFLTTFVEVGAFTQITHPDRWFIFMFAFFAVSLILYAWDLHVIRQKRGEFVDTPERLRLYDHIYRRQRAEFAFLLPAAVVFHGIIVFVLWQWPDVLLADHRHVLVVAGQAIVGAGYLISTIREFSVRQRLLTDCIEDPEPVATR